MKNPRHLHIGIKTPKKRALSLWLALITPLVCAGTARAEGGADPNFHAPFFAKAAVTRRATSLPNGNSCIVFSDSFDGVTALALPAGWVATNAQGAAPLSIPSTTTPETAPNDALIEDSAAMSLPESSVSDGSFTDISAGGSVVTGDNVAIISAPGSPPPSPTPTPTPTPTPCSTSNGGLLPRVTSESGVAAPSPGFFWSEVQHNTGNTTQANTNAGYNDTQGGGFRLADDFTISQTCTINNVVFYGYLTGAPATPSPFTAYTLQIWNGRPGDPGSVVVFGDTTTNRLASSTDSTFFRIFNTVVPPPGIAQGTTRKIWRNTVNVGGITLPPGTYWIDWASTVTGAANHFAPSKTIAGARGAAGDNARQFATGAWVDVTDVGTPAGGTPVPQDFPFDLNGTPSTVTPTPSPTVTPSVTPTVTPSATPTPTPTLTPTPPPPVITSPLVATGTVGLPFTYQFEASGATSLAAGNLAPGLTFNTSLRAITGTPTTAGTFQAGLSATNSGGTTNATLTITVQAVPPSGPVIGSSTAVTGRVGQPFRFQVYTTGGTPAARVSASGLPPGLSINAVSGLISGTPTAAGSSAVTLTVTDGAFTTSSILEMTFTVDPALPVIISPNSVSLTPGQFFSYTINAPSSAGPSDPTIFTLIGTLPGGLTFNAATGTISGTYTGPLRSAEGGPSEPDLAGGTLLGSIQLFATNSHGTSTFELLLLTGPSGAVNISTRLLIGTGENVLIGGFIITGNTPKVVIIRAIGPSTGIPGALQDPTLELHSPGRPDVFNDNWRDSQEQIIIGSGLQPTDNRESAIVIGLDPGPYTAIVAGKNGTTGIALVEVYDLGTASIDTSGIARLANIATRGFVNTGDNVMIGGFIIGRVPTRLVVRAIGPSLTGIGISGALPDPTLALKNANGTTLISNNDWQDDPTQAAEIQQRVLAPTNPRESALVTTLQPGSYTAIVSGQGGTIGVAVVEGYTVQ